MWAYVTDILLNRPAFAVKRTGIQSLAWLPDLERPGDSIKLTDAAKIYADFAKVSKNEHARIRRAWEEFIGIVEVATVREITHEVVETYENAPVKRPWPLNGSGKKQSGDTTVSPVTLEFEPYKKTTWLFPWNNAQAWAA